MRSESFKQHMPLGWSFFEGTQDQAADSSFARELLAVGLLLMLFCGGSLAIASRSPLVWLDEVGFIDPAVNLYLDGQFVSTANEQSVEEFWATSLPLYQFLLSGWLHLFGFGMVAVRSFNVVVGGAGVFLLWAFARRTRLVPTPGWRLGMTAALLSGMGISSSYLNGRPDILGLLLLAVTAWAFLIRHSWLRYAALFACGFVLSLTAPQLIMFAGLLGMLVLVWSRLRLWRNFLAGGLGLVAGGLTTYLIYQKMGVWDSLSNTTRGYSILKVTLEEKLALLPLSLTGDYSSLVLLALALLAACYVRWSRGQWACPFLLFALAAGILIPSVIHCVGRYFPFYYWWMAYVPLTVGVCAGIGWEVGRSRAFQALAVGAFLAAGATGPSRPVIAGCPPVGAAVVRSRRAAGRPDDSANR